MGTNVAMPASRSSALAVRRSPTGCSASDGRHSSGRLGEAPWGLGISVIVAGLSSPAWALGKTAEYYTGNRLRPVKKIAQQSETGPATTIGRRPVSAIGMVSVFAVGRPDPRRCRRADWGGEQTLGRRTAVTFGGLYGIAVAAIGMLATTGRRRLGRRLRPDRRQRRRHRRDGRARPVGPRGHRRARLARQHHRCGRQGLRRRVRRAHRTRTLQELRVRDRRSQQRAKRCSASTSARSTSFIGLFLGAGLPFLFAALTIDAVGRAANEDDRRGPSPVPRDPGPA